MADSAGMIGPNAVLQVLPVLERVGGRAYRDRILASANLTKVPDGLSMIPETEAARLHKQLRLDNPKDAQSLSATAGVGTADYILENRIPRMAQWVLKSLPKGPAARLLSSAIAKHAWTFCGSGRFSVVDPWTLEIDGNPLIAGEISDQCLCHWNAAVFERLYQTLVHPSCRCVETRCGAQGFGGHCCFEISTKIETE